MGMNLVFLYHEMSFKLKIKAGRSIMCPSTVRCPSLPGAQVESDTPFPWFGESSKPLVPDMILVCLYTPLFQVPPMNSFYSHELVIYQPVWGDAASWPTQGLQSSFSLKVESAVACRKPQFPHCGAPLQSLTRIGRAASPQVFTISWWHTSYSISCIFGLAFPP